MPEQPGTVGPGTTSFTVRGTRNGSVVVVRWDEGRLSGDPPTLDLIEVEADLTACSGHDPLVQRTPGVAHAGRGNLHDPQDAFAVVCHVFDRVNDVSEGT